MPLYKYHNKMLSFSIMIIDVFCHVSGAFRTNLRILEGHEADTDLYPYVVTLEGTRLHSRFRICTGSLIARNWVITAAHCFFSEANITHIRYGNMESNDYNHKDITISKVVKGFPHHNYLTILELTSEDVFYGRNDIGLLQVNSVTLKEYGKLSAIDYASLVGYPIKILGYGQNKVSFSEYAAQPPVPLQEAEGTVVQCDEKRLNKMYICLSYKCNKIQYAYPGDSGGPLLHLGKIAGVFSQVEVPWGMGFYWPVSPYLSWIRDTIKLNDQSEI